MLAAYLPSLLDLANVAVTWALAVVLFAAGRACIGRARTMELCLIAGWGAFCLVMTVWGTVLPLSLYVPAWGFVGLSLLALWAPSCRPSQPERVTIYRLALVTLPVWLILAPLRPSQPDTFLNLLPNSMYLVDHGIFPSDARTAAYSFLPGAPYNTQLASFLGALANPDFPPSGMSLFNLLLQLAAGLLIARRIGPVDSSKPLSWFAISAGFLAATLLNPGFVPRIFLTSYGEPALAVTALFAAVLMRRTAARLAEGQKPEDSRALGLVLAAMINTKQSAIGLVLALAIGFFLLSVVRTPDRWRAALGFILKSLILPAIIYGIWRLYVDTEFATGELKPLPFAAWQWHNLPQIFISIVNTMAEKPVFFLPAILLMVGGMIFAFRKRRNLCQSGRAAFLFSAVFLAYNGFLVMTYIAHFPGDMSTDAHSYYRYNTHLSLALVFTILLLIRELPWRRVQAARWAKPAMACVILLAVITPAAFAQRLRFDLDQPQPLVWTLAKDVAPYLNDNSKLALLLPGDNGSVAAMLEGVLRATPPRRAYIDLFTVKQPGPQGLTAAADAGYRLLLVSCTDAKALTGDWGLPSLPQQSAALLRLDAGRWILVQSWPYDQKAYRKRWQHILSWGPLCRPEQTVS